LQPQMEGLRPTLYVPMRAFALATRDLGSQGGANLVGLIKPQDAQPLQLRPELVWSHRQSQSVWGPPGSFSARTKPRMPA